MHVPARPWLFGADVPPLMAVCCSVATRHDIDGWKDFMVWTGDGSCYPSTACQGASSHVVGSGGS
jgi:hypothetical protein